MCRLPVKCLSKVQNFLWNYALQIRPYLGTSKCWGHGVLQTPALVVMPIGISTGNSLRNYHTFTSEFLEPYSNGNCDIHNNCLGCMTDALCAWCDLDNSCVPRNISGEGSVCTTDNSDTMLVTDGGVCPVCHDHVDCSSCAQVCQGRGQCVRRDSDTMLVTDGVVCPMYHDHVPPVLRYCGSEAVVLMV